MKINLLEDNTIIKKHENEYEYQANISGSTVLFNDAANTYSHLVAIKNNDKLLRFNLKEATPTSTLIEESIVTYPDAFQGVDLRYTVLPDKLKEDLVIYNREARHKFSFATLEDNIYPSFNEDGSIIYKDEEGNLIWTIDAPYAYDKDGKELEVYLEYQEDSYSVEVITDETTVYPIILDPTITVSTLVVTVFQNAGFNQALSTSRQLFFSDMGIKPSHLGLMAKYLFSGSDSSYSASLLYCSYVFRDASNQNIGSVTMMTVAHQNIQVSVPAEAESIFMTAYVGATTNSLSAYLRIVDFTTEDNKFQEYFNIQVSSAVTSANFTLIPTVSGKVKKVFCFTSANVSGRGYQPGTINSVTVNGVSAPIDDFSVKAGDTVIVNVSKESLNNYFNFITFANQGLTIVNVNTQRQIINPDFKGYADLSQGALTDVVAQDNIYKLGSKTATTTLSDTFDEATSSFTYTGNWLKSTAQKFSGTHSYKAASIGNNGTTSTQFTVNIPSAGELSYYRYVSSEAGYDRFISYINNVAKESVSGALTTWTKMTYPLAAGTNIIKFTYMKDSSGAAGLDSAFIDNLQVSYSGMDQVLTGSITSAPIDISSVVNQDQVLMTYDAITPEGTSITLEYSTDGGTVWSPAPNTLTEVSEINTASTMLLRATLTSDSIDKTPELISIKIFHKSMGGLDIPITVIFDSRRDMLNEVNIVSDTNRRTVLQDLVLLDETRKISKTDKIVSDTRRRRAKSENIVTDTRRRVSKLDSFVADTSRNISLFVYYEDEAAVFRHNTSSASSGTVEFAIVPPSSDDIFTGVLAKVRRWCGMNRYYANDTSAWVKYTCKNKNGTIVQAQRDVPYSNMGEFVFLSCPNTTKFISFSYSVAAGPLGNTSDIYARPIAAITDTLTKYMVFASRYTLASSGEYLYFSHSEPKRWHYKAVAEYSSIPNGVYVEVTSDAVSSANRKQFGTSNMHAMGTWDENVLIRAFGSPLIIWLEKIDNFENPIITDTRRRVHSGQKPLIDTNRRIRKTDKIASETTRSVAVDDLIFLDTKRDVMLDIINILENFDATRLVVTTVNTLQDVNRHLIKEMVLRSDSTRRVSKNTQIALDALLCTSNTVLAFCDTKRNAIQTVDINYDALREVIKEAEILIDSNRKTLNSKSNTSDTLRQSAAAATILLDTLREVFTTEDNTIILDTLRQVALEDSAVYDALRALTVFADTDANTLRQTANSSDLNLDSERIAVKEVLSGSDTTRSTLLEHEVQSDSNRKTAVNTITASDTERKTGVMAQIASDTKRTVHKAAEIFLDLKRRLYAPVEAVLDTKRKPSVNDAVIGDTTRKVGFGEKIRSNTKRAAIKAMQIVADTRRMIIDNLFAKIINLTGWISKSASGTTTVTGSRDLLLSNYLNPGDKPTRISFDGYFQSGQVRLEFLRQDGTQISSTTITTGSYGLSANIPAETKIIRFFISSSGLNPSVLVNLNTLTYRAPITFSAIAYVDTLRQKIKSMVTPIDTVRDVTIKIDDISPIDTLRKIINSAALQNDLTRVAVMDHLYVTDTLRQLQKEDDILLDTYREVIKVVYEIINADTRRTVFRDEKNLLNLNRKTIKSDSIASDTTRVVVEMTDTTLNIERITVVAMTLSVDTIRSLICESNTSLDLVRAVSVSDKAFLDTVRDYYSISGRGTIYLSATFVTDDFSVLRLVKKKN